MPRKKESPLHPSRHPTEDELRLYVKGRHSGWDENQLETHLLLCDECQAKLDAIEKKRVE